MHKRSRTGGPEPSVKQPPRVSISTGAHEKKCRQERATPTYLIEFRV